MVKFTLECILYFQKDKGSILLRISGGLQWQLAYRVNKVYQLEADWLNAPVWHVLGAIYKRNDHVSKSRQRHAARSAIFLGPSISFAAAKIDQMQPRTTSVDWGENEHKIVRKAISHEAFKRLNKT